MKRTHADDLADETRRSYDEMATEFSASRATFWEELEFLAAHIDHDDHVLDIGCGNGRFFPLVKERHAAYTGIDYSEGLITLARKKAPEGTFSVADATSLPFGNDEFDIAYSFAVIHHIPGRAKRRAFAREAYRVLHPGSKFIVTTWDLWSMRHFPALFATALASLRPGARTDIGDAMLTFGKRKHPRYVHAFTMNEFTRLFRDAGFGVIAVDTIARKSGERNIVLVLEKPYA